MSLLWTVVLPAPLSMGFPQGRVLEWAVISFSRGSSWFRDWTCVTRASPALQADSLPLSHCRSFQRIWVSNSETTWSMRILRLNKWVKVSYYDNETRLLTARESSYKYGRVQKATRSPVVLGRGSEISQQMNRYRRNTGVWYTCLCRYAHLCFLAVCPGSLEAVTLQ